MQKAGDRKGFLETPLQTGRLRHRLLSPMFAVGTSLAAFVGLFWATMAIAAGGVLPAWNSSTGWDPWFQSMSLLAPLAALPLVLLPAWARERSERSARGVLSVALLFLYAASLYTGAVWGSGTERGLWLYFLVLGILLAIVSIGERGMAARRASRAIEGPLFRGTGSALLVGGALAYAFPVAGIVSVPSLFFGLVAMVAGASWAGTTRRLHPLAPCRRTLVSALAALVGLAILLAATVHWCFARPLVFLLVPPALIGLVSALMPPYSAGTDALAVPPGAYQPRVGRKWARSRAVAGALSAILLTIAAMLAAGWLPLGLCL